MALDSSRPAPVADHVGYKVVQGRVRVVDLMPAQHFHGGASAEQRERDLALALNESNMKAGRAETVLQFKTGTFFDQKL